MSLEGTSNFEEKTRKIQPFLLLILALFLLPLFVILVILVILPLRGYSWGDSIEEIYLSSDKIAGISAWSAGFCLSLIAYYAFIHDKSKSKQESILREKSERRRTAESFIARNNTKYDIVKQQITEYMIVESKHSKSDDDSNKDMVEDSFIRLRRSCLLWIREIDIEIDSLDGIDSLDEIDSLDGIDSLDEIDSLDGIDSLDEIDSLDGIDSLDEIDSLDGIDSLDDADSLDIETDEAPYSKAMTKSVTLHKGGDRTMTFEEIKNKIEKEAKENTEESMIKNLPAFEEMTDALHNFYNRLVDFYSVE